MVLGRFVSASALFTVALAAGKTNGGGGGGGNNNAAAGSNNAAAGNNNAAAGADSTTLLASVIQKGSQFDGLSALGSEDFQAAALTSNNNFINFCAGSTLTNGLQIVTGSCNGIPMGQIPAKTKMISTIILNPKPNDVIASGKDFTVNVQVNGLTAGFFSNADATYYSSPQNLDANGFIKGHTHITIQDMGKSIAPTAPMDPTQFAFFKGINDAGNTKGGLNATVAGGLPPGSYRVCTLTSATNHQPVIMPVAQRGSQDDCTKFTVNGNNNTINVAANNGSKGQAAASLAAEAVSLGAGAVTSGKAAATAAAAASGKGKGGAKADTTSSAAAANTNTAAAGKGNGKGGAKANTATTAAAAANTNTAAAGKGGAGKGGAKANTATAAAAAANTNTAAAGKGGAGKGGAGKGGKGATSAAAAATSAAATTAAAAKGGAGKGGAGGAKAVAVSTKCTSAKAAATGKAARLARLRAREFIA